MGSQIEEQISPKFFLEMLAVVQSRVKLIFEGKWHNPIDKSWCEAT